MKHFEYKTFQYSDIELVERDLNTFAAEGWELIHFTSCMFAGNLVRHTFVMKREKTK